MADPATDRFVAQVPGLLRELERRGKALFGLTLTPTVDSLPALEQIAHFLHQARASFDQQDQRINILLLGTYLGEIVRRDRAGAWRVDPALGLPLVDLSDGTSWSPMDAVRLRLEAETGAFHLPQEEEAVATDSTSARPR
jgi:hypothetical protein